MASDDIVARLRGNLVREWDYQVERWREYPIALASEAADEIDRLRSEIAALAGPCQIEECQYPEVVKANLRATQAQADLAAATAREAAAIGALTRIRSIHDAHLATEDIDGGAGTVRGYPDALANWGEWIGEIAEIAEATLSASPAFTLTEEMRAGMLRIVSCVVCGPTIDGKWYALHGPKRIGYFDTEEEAYDAVQHSVARAAWAYVLGVIAGEGERG